MNNFEQLKSCSLEGLADWLDINGNFEGSPWMTWFNNKYCENCESIMCHYPDSEHEFPCSWCELNNNKCKYFPELEEAPDNRDIIEMWLREEADE